jgi:hypothetical protein
MGNLCCAREHSVQFSMQFIYTVKLHSLTWSVLGPLDINTHPVGLLSTSNHTFAEAAYVNKSKQTHGSWELS